MGNKIVAAFVCDIPHWSCAGGCWLCRSMPLLVWCVVVGMGCPPPTFCQHPPMSCTSQLNHYFEFSNFN